MRLPEVIEKGRRRAPALAVIARFDGDSHCAARVSAARHSDEVKGGAASRLAQPLTTADSAIALAISR
ncbi:MAG: hypothetical protein EOO80_00530 [Oxalobacteraceae bacterium]|nr:MAG: hypothetical protein EOO80_00530 [Oxalobacteraceae bacterium]